MVKKLKREINLMMTNGHLLFHHGILKLVRIVLNLSRESFWVAGPVMFHKEADAIKYANGGEVIHVREVKE